MEEKAGLAARFTPFSGWWVRADWYRILLDLISPTTVQLHRSATTARASSRARLHRSRSFHLFLVLVGILLSENALLVTLTLACTSRVGLDVHPFLHHLPTYLQSNLYHINSAQLATVARRILSTTSDFIHKLMDATF